MIHRLDFETNPWRLDEDAEPVAGPAPIPEAKLGAPMAEAKKKDKTILIGLVCMAALGLFCGIFVAAFIVPIKLVLLLF